ncbi:MAG: hypothetical protein LUE93_14795 [Bacteroides sp.]|nr:hypothetical protein [Bacteroides sp.]
MSLKYHIVCKKDMRKGAPEEATLYYGQVRANERIGYEELCQQVSDYTLSTDADVTCILDGLVLLMRQYLTRGNIVELGVFGNFRMSSGGAGVEKEEDFHPSQFRTPRILFTPGVMLKDATHRVGFEKIRFVEKEKECDQSHPI